MFEIAPPVLDVSELLSGSGSAAALLGRASEDCGLVYLENHGVPSSCIELVFSMAKRFFTLPLARKMQIAATRDHYLGYVPVGTRINQHTGEGDKVEQFKMHLDLESNDPDVVSGKPLHQLNRWPDGIPCFRETLCNYYDAMHGLSLRLLRGYSQHLSLEEEFFTQKLDRPLSQLSLMLYPPRDPHISAEQLGVRAHRDTGLFTILAQHPQSGLEFCDLEEVWRPVAPARPGLLLVGVGQLFVRWTNDRFTAPLHRVVNRSLVPRYSIPFFVFPRYDAEVRCLESCRPGSAHYPPISVGESILQRYSDIRANGTLKLT